MGIVPTSKKAKWIIAILVTILPIALGFGVGNAACTTSSDTGEDLVVRPPSWFFAVAWSFLYILFGLAWARSLWVETNIVWYSFIWIFYTFSLSMSLVWLINYNCLDNHIHAFWTLTTYFASTFACIIVSPKEAQLLLVPQIGWALTATLLNFGIVQLIDNPPSTIENI